ncbi:hypothetical protein [Streptomyces albireticuli]|uniref:hypothetical protein n=1 Tax=Streptomyces albireticuli TaxID=1940 RepID=UPI0014754E5F|nr:hypothetical protein [Streptomyces albireticuli]MCD9145423.1 hypothetical protein [Streptomyces albireticuli]MCD9165012.1 hypothetical protein [Streptomyces albireticuli]MCD9195397.1 hypothetical protein [Streptomyces albireticuli]
MRIRTRYALGAAASAMVLAGTLGAGDARAADLPPVSTEQCFSGGGTLDVTIGDDYEPVLVCEGGSYDGSPIGDADGIPVG